MATSLTSASACRLWGHSHVEIDLNMMTLTSGVWSWAPTAPELSWRHWIGLLIYEKRQRSKEYFVLKYIPELKLDKFLY